MILLAHSESTLFCLFVFYARRIHFLNLTKSLFIPHPAVKQVGHGVSNRNGKLTERERKKGARREGEKYPKERGDQEGFIFASVLV